MVVVNYRLSKHLTENDINQDTQINQPVQPQEIQLTQNNNPQFLAPIPDTETNTNIYKPPINRPKQEPTKKSRVQEQLDKQKKQTEYLNYGIYAVLGLIIVRSLFK